MLRRLPASASQFLIPLQHVASVSAVLARDFGRVYASSVVAAMAGEKKSALDAELG